MLLMEHTAFHDTDRMTPAEIEISEEALRFARSNKKSIARRLTDKAIYPSEESPVSVFMAGSPGAENRGIDCSCKSIRRHPNSANRP